MTLAGVLFAFLLNAQSVATGYVYEDTNANGKRDRREPGIADVSVSNGTDVVLTDANGKYQLPVGNDNILFVIKPSGYDVPVNEYNQPQYYYIHKPQGAPELKYAGVAPTGELPKSVDFGLRTSTEPERFTALIFGDPQAYNLSEIDYFYEGIVKELEGVDNVAFGISLGDLVGDDLVLHPPYIEAVGKVGVPWYNVIGNHDLNFDVDVDSLSDETFESHFGPANYAFNYGNAHFIVLDDILYPDPRGGRGYWGGFRQDQLDFVENNLKHVPHNKLVVLSIHIPLRHINENAFRNADRQRLFDLLKDYPNVLTLSAHTHYQTHNFYGVEDGWHGAQPFHEFNAGTTSGDWYSGEFGEQGVPNSTMRDGTPRGYVFLQIDDNKYQIDYKVAGKSADYQIELFHPQVVAAGRNTSAGIFANFFLGHKDNLVEYRINDGAWQPMAYTSAPDPAYMAALMRWDLTDTLFAGRRPSNAVNSTHLWRGNIPTNLPFGQHRIEVRATDRFGRTFTQESSYRLESPKTVD